MSIEFKIKNLKENKIIPSRYLKKTVSVNLLSLKYLTLELTKYHFHYLLKSLFHFYLWKLLSKCVTILKKHVKRKKKEYFLIFS